MQDESTFDTFLAEHDGLGFLDDDIPFEETAEHLDELAAVECYPRDCRAGPRPTLVAGSARAVEMTTSDVSRSA
jgi:hypothetical protein